MGIHREIREKKRNQSAEKSYCELNSTKQQCKTEEH